MSKKKGFSLKSLFVVSNEDEVSEKDSSVATKVEVPEEVAESPNETPTVIDPGKGEEDAKISDYISESLEKANQEGFDYFEFAQIIQEQAKAIPSEKTRFQSTFTTAKVMGVTSEKLVSSAEGYLGVLKNTSEEFAAYIAKETESGITALQTKEQDIEKEIKEKSDLIQKLTEEINTLSENKSNLSNTISENRLKIEKKQNDFAATMKVFVDKIKADIDKMKKYLTPQPEQSTSQEENDG